MKPKFVKMLMVDDDVLIVEMMRDFFKSSGNDYEFFMAEDGEEALQVCLEKKPDIIITDIMLPKMSGIELITALRAMPDFAVTPIIAITAGADAMKEAAKKAGAHMVLEKPLRRIEIVQKVDELLSATPFITRQPL